MPRQNIIFAIVAPLVLMAIIAVIVVTIGETLLTVHAAAAASLGVEAAHNEAERHDIEEVAALYPVAVALAIATLFLIGGAVASRMAPQRPHH